jgi:dTDP-glucose 4,6-dehydratase
MRLLVTGGLGFIGSNFVLKFLNENPDSKILNVDAELDGSNKKNLESLENSPNYEYVKGNITNRKFMEKQIEKSDAVVNFAAESFVDRSISDANPFLVSNIRGAFTVLDIITKQKKRMVQISTDEVFGSLSQNTANENSKFNPSSPYAATKAAAELIINSYSATYDCDVIITRCTNNYGPRQFAEKLIPKTIILANQNKKIPIYGSGKNIRDWILVDDHCDAVSLALSKGKRGESYNISANNEVDNLTIVKKILNIMGKSEDLIEFVEDRPGHDFRYSMSSKKISDELDWKIKINFEEGLEKTIEWYLDNPEILNNISQTVLDSTPWKNNYRKL